MAKKTALDKSAQNDEQSKNNDDSVNEDEEPNFSDPEDFVDEITDEGKSRFYLVFPRVTPTSTSATLRRLHVFHWKRASSTT